MVWEIRVLCLITMSHLEVSSYLSTSIRIKKKKNTSHRNKAGPSELSEEALKLLFQTQAHRDSDLINFGWDSGIFTYFISKKASHMILIHTMLYWEVLWKKILDA